MADMTVHIPWAGDVSDYILLEYDAGGRSLRYRCVTPNEGTAPRSKRISVRTATGKGRATFVLTQQGMDAFISVAPSAMSFEAAGAPSK